MALQPVATATALLGALLSITTPAKAGQMDGLPELKCLALNIYFEARGETREGQVAVAHVTMNRAHSRKFPDTVCGVVKHNRRPGVKHKCQFSWYCDGRSDEPTDAGAWGDAIEVAHAVYWGQEPDPTDGALWYHAIYVKPVWRHKLKRRGQIGEHIFYVNGR